MIRDCSGTDDTVQASAFGYCGSLTDVYFLKTRADAEKITFGTGNTAITGATWHFETVNLDMLRVLYLPEGLTEIKANAFEGLACEAVIVPDHCTGIGSKAFANCRKLIYISIPAGTAVAADAFDGCASTLIIDRK